MKLVREKETNATLIKRGKKSKNMRTWHFVGVNEMGGESIVREWINFPEAVKMQKVTSI